jgi:Nuclease-related domain
VRQKWIEGQLITPRGGEDVVEMRVDHLPCGAFVNASEKKAFDYIRARLQSELGNDRFLVLTNVVHSVSANAPADEIDMIILGPAGVQVIEVKHWDRNYLRRNKWVAEQEVDKLELKTRKVATRLRAACRSLGRIDGKLLLTRQSGTLREQIRGISLYALEDWKALINLDRPHQLSADQLDALAEVIEPRANVALRGEMSRLGNIVELNRLTPEDERFDRVYRGRHRLTQDRVILHLYDLSVEATTGADAVARRAFDVLLRLQKSPWLPRLIDSLQELPNYPGELLFFTIADSDAPTLADRAVDPRWNLDERLAFAANALQALSELHEPPEQPDAGVIHRTITPGVIRVRPGNRPLFVDWRLAKLPGHTTIASAAKTFDNVWMPPEVRSGGLAAADRRSDV